MIKSRAINSLLVVIGVALSLYPIIFIAHIFSRFDSLIRYVGTEYDIVMAFSWLVGSIIFLILTLYNKSRIDSTRRIFAGVTIAYAISAVLFSHQYALSQFNKDRIFLRGGTIIIAGILIIMLIKEYIMKRDTESKKTFEFEIAVLSIYYYGFALVLFGLLFNSIFNANAFNSTIIVFYVIWSLSAASGVLCISKKRIALILTLVANLVNVSIYAVLIAGTVYFGENIAEALESGVPGLFVSLTLIRCSLITLSCKKNNKI